MKESAMFFEVDASLKRSRPGRQEHHHGDAPKSNLIKTASMKE
jgi:hypothetical protein